jgi:hypothetical protein
LLATRSILRNGNNGRRIDAQADSGEFLNESGFYFMPTCEDIRLLMIEGERIYIEELERDMRKEF